jgi:PAS domain S-box-containing protein
VEHQVETAALLRELDHLRARVAILEQVDAERQRVTRQLRDETRITETLNRIGGLLAAELDLQRLVQIVTDETTVLVGAQFGAFFYNVLDERGESFTLYALSGVPRAAFDGFPMPRNTSIFGPTFRGEGVIRLDDVTSDPRYGQNPPYRGMPEGHLPVRSYLAVPVIDRAGNVLGGLFYGHAEPGIFRERDEQLVIGVAGQAAVAIDNARLVQDLHAERARYRTLFEGVGDVILVTDARGRLIDVNTAAVAQLGHTRAALRAMSIGGVVAGGTERIAAGLAEAAETGRWQGELDLIHANGTTLPVEVSSTRVALPQQAVLVSVMRDISGRRQVEKMQREFTRLVTHELKAPLTSVKGFAQLLFRRAQYDQHAVEVILGRTRQLEHIINDLLDVASIDGGRFTLYPSDTDLVALTQAACELARATTDNHEISLDLPRRPIVGCWDATRITQVLHNLLSNAVKYSPAGGAIRVTLGERAGSAVLTVEDHGIGIPQAALPHLFSRFFRVEAVDTASSQGLGLGLFISRTLVEAHGGHIWADSQTGHGSTFGFSLPLSTDDSAPPRRHTADWHPPNTMSEHPDVGYDNPNGKHS